ncbi:MAG: nuclear transport factor 2 family protein [Chloroflexota bacterium]
MATAEGPAAVVRGINAAWQSGDFASLTPLLSPDVVFVHPSFSGTSSGRDICVGSYREFASLAQVQRFDEIELDVREWGDTAVATCHFEIEYLMSGERHFDRGHDLFVLQRAPAGWQVIWRTMVA